MTRITDGVRRKAPAVGQTARTIRSLGPAWREARSAIQAVWRGPGRERDLVVQSLKAAMAALLAWYLAGEWLDDPLALMAPWVALVLVQATVYGSLLQAGQQFAAICVGTLLASAAQAATGETLGALALSVPALMLLAKWPRFGDQGIYAATTAVFTIASGTVSASEVGHRVGQAALGAVVGVAVNALVLPPVHLRDVRENLTALAQETGDVLHAVAADLRQNEWDVHTAADWLAASARLERRLDALRSARRWSRESLRLTGGPLRAIHRVPQALPPPEEDERFSRVTSHVTTLTRTLVVAADERRTPEPPDPPTLRSYARLLDLIGDACHREGRRLSGALAGAALNCRIERAMRKLQRQLQDGLREHAEQGPARTAVLGTLLLQAENLWAETLPDGTTPEHVTPDEPIPDRQGSDI